jgi:putative ABC transport system ATP-binding protein
MIQQSTNPDNGAEQSAPLVRLEGVSKSFAEAGQRHHVLHEASASFAAGEIVALMGKSGSGKSTLLNLISGIDTPDSGQVWIAGQALTSLSEHERTLFRRRSIGFVFQFFNLVPTLSVLENILLPLELNGHSGRQAQQTAHALLEQVGLANRASSYPDRLSGGEQQRIALARALAHDPPLLLADEPTGNLDSETSSQVLELLNRLTRQAGKTLLLVTHSTEVAALADRMLYLRAGQFEETAVPVNAS